MTDPSTTRDVHEQVRLVVADVDGTLVTPDKILTPQACAAVRHVVDAGIAFTITVLSALLAIPTAQIATIGDMPNDVLMFERSGVSIAMVNASAEVQRAATFVTASNVEEGFALAMERYVLGARPVT